MPAIVCRKNSGGPDEIHNFSQQIVDLLGIVKKMSKLPKPSTNRDQYLLESIATI